ncbi:MAG: hypothetical protein F4062_03090 [Acidimicrobiia bacterium]|nr:hypothetical protein [Acidimicrobiia bacterium]
MAVEVESRDCTAVSDAELEAMADLCAEGPNPFTVGFLSKQTELWVLLTEAREGSRLRGFVFSTLERIGGTPVVILGAGSVARTSRRSTVLQALVAEQLHRAVMAFPDEDVLMGVRMNDPSTCEVFKVLSNVIPRPDHGANGEERAWGRRLAKRYRIGNSAYDPRSFMATGDGGQPAVLDYETLRPEQTDPALVEMFAPLQRQRGDSLVAVAWATAGRLQRYGD